MVIARLHDNEQVERIGLELRLVRQATRGVIDDARRIDLRLAPDRHRLDRRVGVINQRLDLVGRQLVAKTQHLRCQPAFADDFLGLRLAQPRQVLRDQRRADAAQTLNTMAGGAMLLVVGRHIGRFGQLCHTEEKVRSKAGRDQDFPVHTPISSSER